jgi:nucleoside-diphosphate-sugar epimerase
LAVAFHSYLEIGLIFATIAVMAKLKVLFIGGTGIISTACVRLAIQRGMEVHVLNRGKTQAKLPSGVRTIHADIQDENQAKAAMENRTFDVVANFVNFVPADIDRDFRLFQGKVGQYFFISSASAYQTPPVNYLVTESTPLANAHWEYSRNKISCEKRLAEYGRKGFPAVVVRPSLTYGDTLIPLSITSWTQSWSAIDRMLKGKPIIIHGDGTNIWTSTHNTDFAKGFVGLFGNARTIGESFHITSDEVLTWNQCYQIVADIVGARPKFVHVSSDLLTKFNPELEGWLAGGFSNSVVFDNSKIKSWVPDFVATTGFKDGIGQTIRHFQANPRLQVVDAKYDQWCDRVIAAMEAVRPI